MTKLAEEYMVNTDGRVVSVKYPNDSEGVTETTIVDPTAEKAKGNGKRSGGTWGKVAVEDKSGGMHYYDSLGQARTRLGVNTDWAANMFENFEKSGFSITKRPDSKDGSGVEMTAPNEWSTWD